MPGVEVGDANGYLLTAVNDKKKIIDSRISRISMTIIMTPKIKV